MTQKTLFPAKYLFKSSKVCMLSQKTARRRRRQGRSQGGADAPSIFPAPPPPSHQRQGLPSDTLPIYKSFLIKIAIACAYFTLDLGGSNGEDISKTFSRTFSMAFSSISKLELHSFPEHSLYNAFNLIEKETIQKQDLFLLDNVYLEFY